jgi:transposase
MGKKGAEPQEPPTIWESPDDVWPLLHTIVDEHSPATPKGHRRVALRRVLHGIIFRVRTGCQWHQLPTPCSDDSPVHRHCQPWCQRGLVARRWAVLVEACDALGGVDWQWQAADTALGNARMGGDGVGRHPTDRGNKGWHAVSSWTRREGPWAPPSRGPMATTPGCWRPPWKPSWWSVPSRPRRSRSISAWTQVTTIRRGMRPWQHSTTSHIAGASARTSSILMASTPIQHGAGS